MIVYNSIMKVSRTLARVLFLLLFAISPALCKFACDIENNDRSHACCPEDEQDPAHNSGWCCVSWIALQVESYNILEQTYHSTDIVPALANLTQESPLLISQDSSLERTQIYMPVKSIRFIPLGSNAPPLI